MHRPSTSQFLPVISLFPLPLVRLSVSFVWLVHRFHITSRERNCATEFNGQRSSDWPSADGRGSAADPPTTTTATTKKMQRTRQNGSTNNRNWTDREGRGGGRGRQTDKRLNGRHRGSDDATAFSSCCFTRYQRSMTKFLALYQMTCSKAAT